MPSPSVARRVLVAVGLSALVCPGAGQVYNRDVKKGLAMIVATVALLVVFLVVIARGLLAALPADPDAIDALAVQTIADRAMVQSGSTLTLVTGAMTLIWVLSTIDAYFGARRRAAAEGPTAGGQDPAPASRISR